MKITRYFVIAAVMMTLSAPVFAETAPVATTSSVPVISDVKSEAKEVKPLLDKDGKPIVMPAEEKKSEEKLEEKKLEESKEVVPAIEGTKTTHETMKPVTK